MGERREAGVSRRDFLFGAGVAGAVVAGAGLAGCDGTPATTDTPPASGELLGTSIETTPAGANEAVSWSWETPPADIDQSQITATIDTDVLVVGAGFAGVIAATAAAEKGAKVTVIEKGSTWSGRGGHITAYGSKMVKQYAAEGYFEEADYTHVIRRLVEWATGRVKEPLHWQFARKSGACMDWLVDLVEPSGLHPTMWDGYYKGPDYTEVPITHFFYDDTTDFIYLDGVSHGLGMAVLIPAVIDVAEKLGVEFVYSTPCVRLIRDEDGPVTGAIAGEEDAYTQYDADAVIIASGDYLDDDEMRLRYNPFTYYADSRLYLPPGISTGDLHKQVMWIGGAMQKAEPHCATIHLESGAQSYNFLHINGSGERFMNEDVNTQSKSCVKEFQGDGRAYTIYDANALDHIRDIVDAGLAGGISCGQQYTRMGTTFDLDLEYQLRDAKIEQGLLFKADTLEELAQMMDVPEEAFIATVDRYNEMVAAGKDTDFGKRAELLFPIDTAPYYGGQLISTLLAASGGLRQDVDCHILDVDDNPIEGLFVCGAAGGDYFSNDYPTICPGTNHGRCMTFGRIAGIIAAGGSTDEIPDLDF